MRNLLGGLGVVGLIIFAVFMFIVGPILLVWSLGVLLPAAGVALTFKSWIAAFLVIVLLNGSTGK